MNSKFQTVTYRPLGAAFGRLLRERDESLMTRIIKWVASYFYGAADGIFPLCASVLCYFRCI